MNDRTIARTDARAQCLADVSALLRSLGFDADELHLARAPLADVLRSAATAPDDDARPTMRPGATS